jgi:YlmC/YmxH family sporulation protein
MINRFSELKNKEVIHICEGSRLGYISDLAIELESGRILSIILPGRCKFLGLFGREDDYVIPWCCIRKIGEDIILVDGSAEEWRVPRKKRSFF